MSRFPCLHSNVSIGAKAAIAKIDQDRRHQKIANAAKVERAESLPFRHQNERVRPLRAAIRVLGECNIVQKRTGESHSRRIIGAHIGAGILQAADDRKRRRLPHVVRVSA